ncbi:MAG TPA: trehalose-phosphatase [Rhodocyclaceae bacterium]|nr:trehalose-phosphatase [Rhodocyclaceae bacterium]
MKAPLPSASTEWAYFLDVDGTLLELADTPFSVQVPHDLKAIISAAQSCCGGALALISGRPIRDLDCLLGLDSLPMAGQHGLEYRDAQGHVHRHSLPPHQAQGIIRRLQALQTRHPGLLIEDKGATLAIHYRLAPALGAYLGRLLSEILLDLPELQLQRGKYVMELKPVGFDKGTAVKEFMAQAPYQGRRPVFIGDDLTDENGFHVVNEMGGLSIKVGPGRTIAQYHLSNVDAVRAWLGTMSASCEAKAKEHS